MRDKKKTAAASPEEQELERRVDAMMAPVRPGQPAASTPTSAADAAQPDAPPPIDIFKGLPPSGVVTEPKTAPDLPGHASKNTEGEKAPPEEAMVPGKEVADPEASGTAAASDPELAVDDVPAADLPLANESANDAATTELDNAETDKAVDDIVAKEGDELLAVQDAAAANSEPVSEPGGSFKAKLGRFFRSKWTWIGLVIILIIVFALPASRYKLAGLVVRKSVSIVVLDSKTNTPVSAAMVTLDGRSAKTDGSGKVSLRVPLGKGTLVASKQYYKSATQTVFVGFKTGSPVQADMVATGRQVPVRVVNKITGQPLAGADITVLGTSAKTDSQGQATIVLPTTAVSDTAAVSLSGYNTDSATITVTGDVVPANTLSLTPSGKVYFLSNASGTIDVVKTNLDGSDRQTVLAGTGDEDPNSTFLLASPDWHYLVLEAQRAGNYPGLYLINTDGDKLTEFDSTNASFTLIGWSGDDFLYDEVKNGVATSDQGRELIKSYDAADGQLNQLDQNQVNGTTPDYTYQAFYNFELLPNLLVYNTQWYAGGSADLSNESDTIRGVQPGGQAKKDYLSLAAATTGYTQAARYQAQAIDYAFSDPADDKTLYYTFSNGTVSSDTSLDPSVFNQTYPTYLASPSNSQLFWSTLRDGQETLFVSDQTGQNQKQVTSPGGLTAWGWYGNKYLLAAKDGSQLYILPVGGSNTPLKVTDYYKLPQPSGGYGYGD